MCLRAGARSPLQTGRDWPPSSLNSNAVGCVRILGPQDSAGQVMGLAAWHRSQPGLAFSLRPRR